MRVAALCDIHGNLPALEAVLREVREARVDRIVVGGDAVLGPMSRETIAYLLDLDIPVEFLYGNCEIAVLDAAAGRTPAVPPQVRSAVDWTAKDLPAAYRDLIAAWPKTVRLDIRGVGPTLFCHATPRNENEIFTRLTPEDRLRPVFDGVNASAVVCGHTHMQFDRAVGPIRVINAGSVGMPFGPAGADWLLLGPDVRLRHTAYDLHEAAERIRATPYPEAEQFAAKYVLEPPSEASMLDLFRGAELK